jgi:small subunit ribosomal protein S20
MPQKHHSEKALRQSIKRAAANKTVKSDLKTTIKKTRKSIEAKDDKSKDLINKAIKQLDKAAQKGLIKKNTAARKKSRLMKAFNKSQAK